MTSGQLIVLGLLVAAFAAGWIARRDRPEHEGRGGAGGPVRAEALELIVEANGALGRAMTAYDVARSITTSRASRAGGDAVPLGREAARVLREATGSLERVADRLAERLGPAYPLADDCSQVVTALSLLHDELAATAGGVLVDEAALAPVELAAREARARFVRGASAVLMLDASLSAGAP